MSVDGREPRFEAGPWGRRERGRSWRDRIPVGVRQRLVGPQGLIQRLSRTLLNVAMIAGAAVIIPPLIGASTVLLLATLSFVCAAALGYLSWFHDLIEGRKLTPAARNRRRGLWLAATIYMVGVLSIAFFTAPAASPAPASHIEDVR